jgi:cytochrome c
MKPLILLSLVAAVASFTSLAHAEDLFATHKCTTCHDADKKKLGPTWKEIAAKYKGTAGAEKLLAKASVEGSKGVWGKIPMPPQPKAAGDADALAKLILKH